MTHPQRADPVVFGPGEGPALWFLRNRMTLKALPEQTGGGFSMYESVLPPGFSPPLHIHRREAEGFYVLEGEVTVRFGDRTESGVPGSFLLLPPDVQHSFVVEGDRPARMLTMLTPGDGLGFFTRAGTLPLHDGLPPEDPEAIQRVLAVAAEYGVEIVGPPMVPTRPAVDLDSA